MFINDVLNESNDNVVNYLVSDKNGEYFLLKYHQKPGSNPKYLRSVIQKAAKDLGFKAAEVIAQWKGNIEQEFLKAQEMMSHYEDKKKSFPAQYYDNEKQVRKLAAAKEVLASGDVREIDSNKIDPFADQVADTMSKMKVRPIGEGKNKPNRSLITRTLTFADLDFTEFEDKYDPQADYNTVKKIKWPKNVKVKYHDDMRTIAFRTTPTQMKALVGLIGQHIDFDEYSRIRFYSLPPEFFPDEEDQTIGEGKYKPGVTVLTRSLSFADLDGTEYEGRFDPQAEYETVKKIRWPYGIDVKFNDASRTVTFKTAKMKTVAKLLNKHIDFDATSAGEVLDLPPELMMDGKDPHKVIDDHLELEKRKKARRDRLAKARAEEPNVKVFRYDDPENWKDNEKDS